MNSKLKNLIKNSQDIIITKEHFENMCKSFAYGNLKISNKSVSKDLINKEYNKFKNRKDVEND